MPTLEENLRAAAEKYLSKEDQEIIELHLEYGETLFAQVHILGYIDGQWKAGHITAETAAEAYKLLGLTDEERARYRNPNKL